MVAPNPPLAPNSKINFTKAILDSLPLPENNQRFTFKDEKERGLIIRITTNGQKTFQLYKKHQGRPIRISLGLYPDMSIENARKSNVLQMRYEQIDWHNKTWRIPDTKNGEPLVLPLTAKAYELLENRRRQSNSLWVFPNVDNPQVHFQDPQKAWNRIRKTATIEIWKQTQEIERLIATVQNRLATVDNYGYTVVKLFATVQTEAEKQEIELPTGLMDIRLHDIRRTFGSYQALAGASLQIIGKSLGHKSMQLTQVYARLHNDPVKASMEKATDVMLGLG